MKPNSKIQNLTINSIRASVLLISYCYRTNVFAPFILDTLKVRSHHATATGFFLSSQLDYMVTSGAVHSALVTVAVAVTALLQMNGFHTIHIALALATATATATVMSQMNGFHTHSLRLRQRQNKIEKKTLLPSSSVNGPLYIKILTTLPSCFSQISFGRQGIQETKLPPVRVELTPLTITGVIVKCC